VDGGANGGLATIAINFAALEKGKLRLTVNGADYSFLNTLPTGSWTAYTGSSYLTVPLQPGMTNIVKFEGGHGGAVNVELRDRDPLP